MGLFHPITIGKVGLPWRCWVSQARSPPHNQKSLKDRMRRGFHRKKSQWFGVFAVASKNPGESPPKTSCNGWHRCFSHYLVGFAKHHRSGGVGLGISLGAMIFTKDTKKWELLAAAPASHGSFPGGALYKLYVGPCELVWYGFFGVVFFGEFFFQWGVGTQPQFAAMSLGVQGPLTKSEGSEFHSTISFSPPPPNVRFQ